MRVHILKAGLVLAAFLLSLAVPTRAQEKTQSSPPPLASATAPSAYPNSADGLRQLLQDCLAAAKSGDQARLAAFIKDMEIPNHEAWFTATFGPEKGERWAVLYHDGLDKNENEMQDFLKQLSEKDGEIVARKVNKAPHPNKDMEWDMLDTSKRPNDIFFAEWKPAGAPENARNECLGYFKFIEGKFRWDGTVSFGNSQRIRIGGDVVAVKLVKRVSPVYPPVARAKWIEGVVTLRVIICKDGSVKILKVLSGDSLLAQAAREAVAQWRYQPTLLYSSPFVGAQPVEVPTTINVVFTLNH